jgi:hypothetical protein
MNARGFRPKEVTHRPECPFCGLAVNRPQELETRRLEEMPVGICDCGAVFACDVTGHNLGSAFIEALVFACNMDWDLAWSLYPGEDYLEKLVEHYDLESHVLVPGGSFRGRRVRGALYFIRMEDDIQEVTTGGVKRKIMRSTPVQPASTPTETGPKSFTRAEVEKMVTAYRLPPLLAIAGEDKRIIRDLQRLIYSGDVQLRLRTADILGRVSAVIAQRDPGFISNLLQRLLNSVSDSAASSWGAIDTIGEIIGNAPDLFISYTPRLYQFLADEKLRPLILKAIGRAARARPHLIRQSIFRFIPCLSDPNPEVRGYAALLFGYLGVPEASGYLEKLGDDPHPVKVYQDGCLEEKTVGQLAKEALARL